MDELRHTVEREVRYANITIIEGHDASQYGIGIVSARIAEMVLNDERAVVPIGSYQKMFGVTLSLPSIVGRGGVIEVLEPEMSDEEREGLQNSADNLNKALERVRKEPRAKIASSGKLQARRNAMSALIRAANTTQAQRSFPSGPAMTDSARSRPATRASYGPCSGPA
jgi:hypothetical protein